MGLEPRTHARRVPLRLDLVVLQLLQDLRVVGRGDHPVEHAKHVLLHRMRLVEVLDQLVVDRGGQCSSSDRCELEPAVGAPAKGRATAVAAVVRYDDVDKTGERRAVVQLEPDDVERHAEDASGKERLAVRAADLLADAEERR
jgi:hypothetical protein